MRRISRTVSFALLGSLAFAVPLFLSALPASGAPEPPPSAPSSPSAARGQDGGPRAYDPENVRGMSRAVEVLLAGVEKYKAHNYTGALETFRAGSQLNPKLALGHLFVAGALLALNRPEEAEKAIIDAEALTDERDQEMRAKALFALADIKERLRKFPEAESAWRVYQQYAQSHPDAGTHPLTAQTRVSYLGDFIKLQVAYEGVRERIRREKDGGAVAR